ncbi:MAG: AI-2E family transporter [Gammaproteobacteria bacterium]|nr:AI-2E family transporter [Gammaproteobacteria bacterium]
MEILLNWLRRTLNNPQVVILGVLIGLLLVVVVFFGDSLGPVLAALVLAYLLEGPVRALTRKGWPRNAVVPLVFTAFVLAVLAALFGLVPLLSKQISQLVQQVPVMFAEGQELLLQLPARYPELFTTSEVNELVSRIRDEVGALGQNALEYSLSSVVGLITLMVYMVLVPLLIFFFMKDKQRIIDWMRQYLPRERALAKRVWRDIDRQIGNYIRGKTWEILIVWFTSYVAFSILGLQFAMLLSLIVGLSVIIPYIGATVVTVPVLAVGLFQWGWSSELAWLAVTYGVIQALDGNVLVPLLFSEVVNLHPIAIIVAILFFGGIWGFWGVFFAIPLATAVQAVLKAWPDEDSAEEIDGDDGDDPAVA